jgi:hypothetical protein
MCGPRDEGYITEEDRDREVGRLGTSAVATRVRHVGEAVAPKARELRDAVAPKVKEIGATVGPKVKEIGSAVGPKVKDIGSAVAPKVKIARRRVGFWIAGEEPRKARRWPAFAAAGIGATAAFFLDPVSGKRRRAVTKDWMGARVRGVGRRTARLGRGAAARAHGIRERIEHSGPEAIPENDATLAHKVESELFQGLDIPSGKININAENGVVFLRGALTRPNEIVEVERRVWDIQGVRGVENLLHLEGTPAPTR